MSYLSANCLTRRIFDFPTRRFHTLVLSLAHAGGPATLAIAWESQVSLYKGWSVCLNEDISTEPLIHSVGWPFCFCSNLTQLCPTIVIDIQLNMVNELHYPMAAYQQQRTPQSHPLMFQYHLFPPYLEPIKIHHITSCTFSSAVWINSLATLSMDDSMSFGRGSPLSNKAILSTIHFLPTARSSLTNFRYFWASNGCISYTHAHPIRYTEWKIGIQT